MKIANSKCFLKQLDVSKLFFIKLIKSIKITFIEMKLADKVKLNHKHPDQKKFIIFVIFTNVFNKLKNELKMYV